MSPRYRHLKKDPEYQAWAHTTRMLLRGLPRWRAHHERHNLPEIVSDGGHVYHYLDVERLHDQMLEMSTPRQREAFLGWIKDLRERDVAESMGLPGQPVFIYVGDLFVKAYHSLGKAA